MDDDSPYKKVFSRSSSMLMIIFSSSINLALCFIFLRFSCMLNGCEVYG
jgi:hypothetical protein